MIAGLLDDRFAVEECDPATLPVGLESLDAAERAAVARATPQRVHEFAAGRRLAHAALDRLGVERSPLVAGEGRMPVWPEGVVGSLTHTRGWCAVAVTRDPAIVALGIDVEPDEVLPIDLLPLVLTDDERQRLEDVRDPRLARLLPKLVFSAKESAYKAQYRATRTLLEFHAFEVEVDAQSGTWTATFSADSRPPSCPWESFQGRWIQHAGLVATATWAYGTRYAPPAKGR